MRARQPLMTKSPGPLLNHVTRLRRWLYVPIYVRLRRTWSGTIQAMTLLSTSLMKWELMTKRSVPQIRKKMKTRGTRISLRLASVIASLFAPCRLCPEPPSSLSHFRICTSHYVKLKFKLKLNKALNENSSLSYGTSPAIWDHTVLPATRDKWTRPALTQASKLVLDLPTPEGWNAELT